jgi:hypothetical protein
VPGSPDSFHYVFFNIEGVTITFRNLLERSHCLNLGLIEEACPNLYQEAKAVFSRSAGWIWLGLYFFAQQSEI